MIIKFFKNFSLDNHIGIQVRNCIPLISCILEENMTEFTKFFRTWMQNTEELITDSY